MTPAEIPSLSRRIVASCAFAVGFSAGPALAPWLFAALVAFRELTNDRPSYTRYLVATTIMISLASSLFALPFGLVGGSAYVGRFARREHGRYFVALFASLAPILLVGATAGSGLAAHSAVAPEEIFFPTLSEIAFGWSAGALLTSPLSAFLAARWVDAILGLQPRRDVPLTPPACVAP